MTNQTAYVFSDIHSRSVLSLGLLSLLFVTSAVRAAETLDLSVPLPPGETLLADVGTYRVFWQSYDQEPVAMPISWSGHFEPRAGVSYQRGELETEHGSQITRVVQGPANPTMT